MCRDENHELKRVPECSRSMFHLPKYGVFLTFFYSFITVLCEVKGGLI